MIIKRISGFKDPVADLAWFQRWVSQLERTNGRVYERISVQTSMGSTHVWGLNTSALSLDALVIFPGARTTPLIWDLDRGLDHIGHPMRIFMVETNGLPNPSDGRTPDIRGMGYGEWATEVMDQLKLDHAFVAGASFGGLVAMKLALVSPNRIKAAFLLNPGCLQSFSMSWKNLYYNLLPLVAPSPRNVIRFLDAAVFCKPNHSLSEAAEQMLVDYEVFAITRYKDKTQKPYDMDEQLKEIGVDTYLLEGDKDLLFPYQKSIESARQKIRTLKDVRVFSGVGHGIETYPEALRHLGETIQSLSHRQ